MRSIIVTGTPGTGKTTVARWISKKYSLFYVDVHHLIKKSRCYESYSRKDKCYEVSVPKLVNILRNVIASHSRGTVIDSHLSHYLPSNLVDLCIVTRAPLPVIHKRLIIRKYSKSKIRDNLDAEIFEVCLTEAEEKRHSIIQIDTSKPWRELLAKELSKLPLKAKVL